VTITDIGILLIVLCVALWAIAAALHRHTVQLETLKSQMQELLRTRETHGGDAGTGAGSPGPRDRMDSASAPASTTSASNLATRQTISK
jgi:hypothetical protein